jgi:hypothetical protein
MSYDDYDADDGSNDSSDSGSAEGKLPVSLMQTEFSLMQFAKRMGRPSIVCSTSGGKYEWLGSSRKSIGP